MAKFDLNLMQLLMQNEQTMMLYAILGVLLIGAGPVLRVFNEDIPTPAIVYLVFAGVVMAVYGIGAYLHRRWMLLQGHREFGRTF